MSPQPKLSKERLDLETQWLAARVHDLRLDVERLERKAHELTEQAPDCRWRNLNGAALGLGRALDGVYDAAAALGVSEERQTNP